MGHAAKEAVAVRPAFQCGGAANHQTPPDLVADHGGDQLAAVHTGVLGHALFFREGKQLRHWQTVEVIQSDGLTGSRGRRRRDR